MKEIKQLDKIAQGFQKSLDKIKSWGPQQKSIQEHLDLIKAFIKQQINMVKLVSRYIQKLRPNEKIRIKKANQQWVEWFSKNEKDIRVGLDTWEALINKNSKIYH